MEKRKEIQLVLRIDDKDRIIKLNSADSHVKKLQHSLDGVNAKKLNGVFSGIDLSLKNIATTMGLAFGAQQALSFIKDSVNEFAKEEQSINKIKQGLHQTGYAAGYTSTELVKVAGYLEKITGVGNEKILNDVTLQLLTFGNITGKTFLRAQEAVLDLSAVLGSDLLSQTIQLGKALDNPVEGLSALRRVGIMFSDAQEASIKKFMEQNNIMAAQKIILDEISSKYGGQAKAAMAGYTGGVKTLATEYEDLQKRIGGDVIPILDEFNKLLRTGVADADKFVASIEKISNAFGETFLPEAVAWYAKNIFWLPKGALSLLDAFAGGLEKDTVFGPKKDGRKPLTDEAAQLKQGRLNIEKEIEGNKKANAAWTAQNKLREEIKEKIKELNEELDKTVPGSADEARVQKQIDSLQKLIKVTTSGNNALAKQEALKKELAFKAATGMDAELIKLKQWYDDNLKVAAGNKELLLMLEGVYWTERKKIISNAVGEIDKLLNELDKSNMYLDKSGYMQHKNLPVVGEKYVDKPDALQYLQDAKDEQVVWAETHYVAMSALEGIRSATSTMWNEFVVGGRQAKNEWDAIWLSFRNTALQTIGEIMATGFFDMLKATSASSGNILTDILSFIPFLGEGGIATKPTLAVVGDRQEAIIPLSKLNGMNFGRAMDISMIVKKLDAVQSAFLDKQFEIDLRKLRTINKRIDAIEKKYKS